MNYPFKTICCIISSPCHLCNLEYDKVELLPVNKPAAIMLVRALVKAPDILLSNPRIGEQLFQFAPTEARRILVCQYEMRYEIADDTIYILRPWHTRERRE